MKKYIFALLGTLLVNQVQAQTIRNIPSNTVRMGTIIVNDVIPDRFNLYPDAPGEYSLQLAMENPFYGHSAFMRCNAQEYYIVGNAAMPNAQIETGIYWFKDKATCAKVARAIYANQGLPVQFKVSVSAQKSPRSGKILSVDWL